MARAPALAAQPQRRVLGRPLRWAAPQILFAFQHLARNNESHAAIREGRGIQALAKVLYEGNQEAATRYEALLTSHCKGERIIEM